MAGMGEPKQIAELLSKIIKTYAQNSVNINCLWIVNGDMFKQNFYKHVPNNADPIRFMNALLEFLRFPTTENEKILNGLFIDMTQIFDMHSAQSEGLIFDEQPPEYVAVRERE